MDILSFVAGIFVGCIIGSYFAFSRIFNRIEKISPGIYSFLLKSDDILLKEVRYMRKKGKKLKI